MEPAASWMLVRLFLLRHNGTPKSAFNSAVGQPQQAGFPCPWHGLCLLLAESLSVYPEALNSLNISPKRTY